MSQARGANGKEPKLHDRMEKKETSEKPDSVAQFSSGQRTNTVP